MLSSAVSLSAVYLMGSTATVDVSLMHNVSETCYVLLYVSVMIL